MLGSLLNLIVRLCSSAITDLLGREPVASAAKRILIAADACTAALALLAADALCVPDDDAEEESHDDQVEHQNAHGGKQAEAAEGRQGIQGTECEGKRIR